MTFKLRLSAAYNYIVSVFEPLKFVLLGTYVPPVGTSWLGAMKQKFQYSRMLQQAKRKVEILTAPPTNSLDCCCNGFHPSHDLDAVNILQKIRRLDRTISWAKREIIDLEGFATSGNFQPALTETATCAGNAKTLVEDLSIVMGEVIEAFIRDTAPPPPLEEAVFPPELM